MEKQPFFQAAMAGMGKYRMGGYGRIAVNRVKIGWRYNKNNRILVMYQITCWS